jgi:hypothetical protein
MKKVETLEKKLKRVSDINKKAYNIIYSYLELQNTSDNPNSYWNGYRALNEFLCELAKLNQHLESIKKVK